MQPKPEGYVDDFTVKYGHCNGIQVNGILAASHPQKSERASSLSRLGREDGCAQANGIHAQGISAKSFALVTK